MLGRQMCGHQKNDLERLKNIITIGKFMLHHTQKLLAVFLAACMFTVTPNALADEVYAPKERQTEEARIRKDIENKLDWHIHSPMQLDGVPDTDRWLFGGLNESILLRSSTGERFGIFESFDDKRNVKNFQIHLHLKDKVTDRFLVYSTTEGCNKGISIAVEQITTKFVVFAVNCSSEHGTYSSPLLFDYASRNCYMLGLDYDWMNNKAPHFKLQNGIYKLHWDVRLRGHETSQSIDYNFKIVKDKNGKWIVKDLPPNDDEEGSGIFALRKLPNRTEYDLPAFVANWETY